MRTRVRNKDIVGTVREDGVLRLGSRLDTSLEVTKDFPTRPYQPGLPLDHTLVLRSGTVSGFANGYLVNRFAPLYNEVVRLPFMEYNLEHLRRALTKHMASANPSSSGTNFSETVSELPKLPDLFKSYGDTQLKRYGNAVLSVEFGWAPLIADLISFLFISCDVDRMYDRIQRLSRKADFTSKRMLDSRSTPITSSTEVLNSARLWIEGRVLRSMSLKGHTFVRYSPDPTGVPPSDVSQRLLAYTAAKGLSVGAYEAWQLVPWSWLSDWAFNTSEYLKATRNVIGASCTESYAAVKAHTVWEFDSLLLPHGLHWDHLPRLEAFSKQRIPLTPDITPSLPVLSPFKLGILSALIAKWV